MSAWQSFFELCDTRSIVLVSFGAQGFTSNELFSLCCDDVIYSLRNPKDNFLDLVRCFDLLYFFVLKISGLIYSEVS